LKQQLSEYGLTPEEWGGQTTVVPISALKKEGIDDLLEAVLLQAELLELQADPLCRARGTIVEGRLEQGRGPVATVLIQQGMLKVGDPFVTGVYSGRVRAMQNERGETLEKAGPSTPVEILGIEDVPSAGDPFIVVEDDNQAKQISARLQQIQRERDMRRTRHVTLDDLHAQIQEGAIKELNVIVKGDVQGSVGAVCESLMKIGSEKVRIEIIHSGVGAISESDVMLASASNAVIIGFNVRPHPHVMDLAKREHVDIRTYRIIYQVISDVKNAMEGMLDKTYEERILGRGEVREVFRLSRGMSIAGLYIQNGRLLRNASVRLLRDSVVVHEGNLSSLRRFKEDVREVQSGFECGIGLENFNDIREGDVIECYQMDEVAPTL
ncbi:MAG: translation initiation factor IF-2, partial [Candidatus Hinthialibacter sp.]